MQLRVDPLENTGGVLDHIAVPEAEDAKAFAAKKDISLTVRDAVSVLSAVGLNDQCSLQTSEIDNVRRDDMLTTEFDVTYAAVAQHRP